MSADDGFGKNCSGYKHDWTPIRLQIDRATTIRRLYGIIDIPIRLRVRHGAGEQTDTGRRCIMPPHMGQGRNKHVSGSAATNVLRHCDLVTYDIAVEWPSNRSRIV